MGLVSKVKLFTVLSLTLSVFISSVNCDDITAGGKEKSSSSLRTIRDASAAKKPPQSVESLTLAELILVLMAKHGQGQTSAAFNSLDQKTLGETMRILLVEVDKPLAADIVAMQQYAQNSDKQLVALIAKIVTGDATVAKDIFMWDEKLRKFPWWVRIRQRMFINLDKYVETFKKSSGTPTAAATAGVKGQEVKS